MDKSPDAFRTISEVADWLGTPAHVLRFWESRFSQVKPVKRAGGRRYYRPSDMVLLGGIKKLLHDDGMTIRGVQKLLREHGVRYVASMSPHLDGVDPIPTPSESLGPVPSAPMAEDVPTGAFDVNSEISEEKVLPFSRPDIPPQPAPNTAPTQPIADVVETAPAAEAEPTAALKAPEAPMVDVDAPFEPLPDQSPQSDAEPDRGPDLEPGLAAPDQLHLQIETPPEPVRSAAPVTTAPSVTSEPPQTSAPVASKPAQVPFDFNLDDTPIDADEQDEAAGSNDVSAPAMDDESFDSALQAALSPENDVAEGNLESAVETPPEPMDLQTDMPASVHMSDDSIPEGNVAVESDLQNLGEVQAPLASPLDEAPEIDAPVADTPTAFEPDLSPVDATALDDNAAPSASFDPQIDTGIDTTIGTEDIADISSPDSAQETATVAEAEFAAGPLGENVDFDAAETIPADAEANQPLAEMTADIAAEIAPASDILVSDIPDDPEDSAEGLDVNKGVLGQLNKKALSEADPAIVQSIFDRATALSAKLSQAG